MPELTRDQIMARRREEMKELKAVFGPSEQKAVTLFEDAPCYPSKDLTELFHIGVRIQKEQDKEERLRLIAEYDAKRDSIQRLPNAPERVYLWPEGKIPCVTEYTDNSDYRYHHNPDFVPFFYEMLVPEDVTPKGLIVFCAGGDHGTALYHEGYQSCLDFNKLGYQAILLANRTNMCPWKGVDAGADAARAIRMARANAKKYRVREDQIAFAGFSNGGLTGEMVIQYFSGDKKMTDYYEGYEPDEYDKFYGAPDANLCIYGPRWVGGAFDYEGVVYPPTFFAIGRLDSAIDNFNFVYPQLLERGVPVEIHTFAGVPHGQAGVEILDGKINYPNFQLWIPLADAFLMDLFCK